MNLLESTLGWLDGAKSSPIERKVAEMLGNKSGIVDDNFPKRVDGSSFISGVSYFGLRLSGLHIVDARRFAVQQLPLCVCLAEFEHGGQRRTIPFSIGPDVIRQKLRDTGIKEDDQAKPAWIELKDLTVVRPTPVVETNVSLYAGLFSIPGSDLVKTLLNVVGTVGTALGQPAIGAGVKVAETVYDSFGSLLGMKEVNQVAAALIGNVLSEKGSGYLLIADIVPDKFDTKSARVVAGRLHWPADVNGGKAVTEFDHALIAIEQYETIIQKETGLAPALFQTQWGEVLKAPQAQFAAALSKLQDSVAGSADITENDRIALLGGYSAAAERLFKARFNVSLGDYINDVKAGSAQRGAAVSNFADRLTRAAGGIKGKSSAERKAAEAIAGVLGDQPASLKPGAETQGDGTHFDEDVFETASAVRTALLAHDVAPAGVRNLASVIGRAASSFDVVDER